MGDYTQFIFIPRGIGIHYLVLRDRAYNEIERYSFEVVEAEEPEEPVIEEEPAIPIIEEPLPEPEPGLKQSKKIMRGADWEKECFDDGSCTGTFSFGRKYYQEFGEWKDIETDFEAGNQID